MIIVLPSIIFDVDGALKIFIYQMGVSYHEGNTQIYVC